MRVVRPRVLLVGFAAVVPRRRSIGPASHLLSRDGPLASRTGVGCRGTRRQVQSNGGRGRSLPAGLLFSSESRAGQRNQPKPSSLCRGAALHRSRGRLTSYNRRVHVLACGRESASAVSSDAPMRTRRRSIAKCPKRRKRHAALHRDLLRYVPNLRWRQEALPRPLTSRPFDIVERYGRCEALQSLRFAASAPSCKTDELQATL